jgi:hypothetical protein
MNDGFYDYMQLAFLVAIAILVVVSGVISTMGKILDRRFRGLRKIRKEGWWFFAVNCLIVVLTVWQFILGRINDNKKEKSQAKIQAKRDSIQRASYDQNTASLVNIILDHGYKLDSENARLIQIVRDSSKTKIIEATLPVLYLSRVSKTNIDTNELVLEFETFSEIASSTKIDVLIYIIEVDRYNNWRPLHIMTSFTGVTIPAERGSLTSVTVHNTPSNLNKFYFYVVGTYSGVGSDKTLNVNQACRYTVVDNHFVGMTDKARDSIIQFCAKHKRLFSR